MIRLRPISTLFPYTTLFRSSNMWSDLDIDGRTVGAREYGNEARQEGSGRRCCTIGERAAYSTSPSLGTTPRAKGDRKSTRLNSSHPSISYAVFCLKKKKQTT